MADYIRRILAKAQFTGNFQSEYPTALIHALLDDVPSEDVRPVVRGRWERHFSRPCVYADLFWHCSVCGYKNAESFANTEHQFCPNCGAMMEES